MLINNSNEFRPACGEDTGLDSLTGRFKRNCWTMVVIRLKQKLGHCSAIGHQSPATTIWWVSVSPKAGNSMECYENVSVEFLLSTPHFLFFFRNVKFLGGGTNGVDSAPDRRWLFTVVVLLRRLNLREQTTCQKSKKWTPEALDAAADGGVAAWNLLAFCLLKCQLHLNFFWDFYSRTYT